MFGRKKHKKAVATARREGGQYQEQHGGTGDGTHTRTTSAATTLGVTGGSANPRASQAPVSPLSSGKFELPHPFRESLSPRASIASSMRPRGDADNFSRPRTSDGSVGPGAEHSRAKSIVSLAPPMLPPIPRVTNSSKNSDGTVSREPSWIMDTEEQAQPVEPMPVANMKTSGKAMDDNDNISLESRRSSRKSVKSLKHQLSFEPVHDLPPFSFQRPATAGASTTSLGQLGEDEDRVVMSASVFPTLSNNVVQPPASVRSPPPGSYVPGPAMNRAFIDSRDRAFPTTGPRTVPSIDTASSTPNLLLSPSSPAPQPVLSPSSTNKTPLSASSSTFTKESRPSPHSINSSPNIPLRKTPTNYSGSTARISHNHSQSSSTTRSSERKRIDTTLGTPYSETSPSFPLPTFVSTRPKTSGANGTIGGYEVPTHHSGSKAPSGPPPTEKIKDPPKKERRKTMLMNPMNLLSRRRTEDPRSQLTPEEKQAQEAALRKQKKVAAIGVEKSTDNFDPSIRGKGVHDFSAPRNDRRNTSYSVFSQDDIAQGGRPSTLQSTRSVPVMAGGIAAQDTQQSATGDDGSVSKRNRRSDHAPIFLEHLSDSSNTGLLAAETRENKDFLQRVSGISGISGISSISQESSTLPPFARRSQVIDPHQTATWNDGGSSKRSSDPSTAGRERDSSISGMSSVSPVTGRTSVANTDLLLRESMNSSLPLSPQSERFPKSPAKTPSLSSGGRPVSDVSSLRSPRPTSIGVALQPSVEPIAEDGPSSPSSLSTPLPSSANASHVRTASEQAPELHMPPAHSRGQSEEAPEVVFQQQSSPVARSITTSSAGPVAAASSPFLAPTSTVESALPSPVFSHFSGRSNGSTPEPMTVDSAIRMRNPGGPAQLIDNRITTATAPRFVEKRPSAVGHSSSKGSLAPKHAKSNASRFSFQMGEDKSLEEEKMLEEKHRQMVINGRSSQSRAGGDRADNDEYDDDEEFDIENAMDDLDEMELQEAAGQRQIGLLTQGVLGSPSQIQTGHVPPAEKDRVVEDDDSVYDEEHIPEVQDESQLGYFDHPAFRAHSALASHTRDGSFATLATLPSVVGSGSIGSMRSGFSGWRGDAVDRFVDSYATSYHQSSPSWGGATIEEERPTSRSSPLAKNVQTNDLQQTQQAGSSSALSKEVTQEDQSKPAISPMSSSNSEHPGTNQTHEQRKSNFYLQPAAAGGSGWSSTWSIGGKSTASRGPSTASRASAVSAVSAAVSDKPGRAPSSTYSSVKGDRFRTTGSQSTKSRQSIASAATDGDGAYSSRAARKKKLKTRRMTIDGLVGSEDEDWAEFQFGAGPDLAFGIEGGKRRSSGADTHAEEDVPPIPKLPDAKTLQIAEDIRRKSGGDELLAREEPPKVPNQHRMTQDSETMPMRMVVDKRNTASTSNGTESARSTAGTWSDRGIAGSGGFSQRGATAATTANSSVAVEDVALGNKPNPRHQSTSFATDHDDMYFDDGGFANEDLTPNAAHSSMTINEDSFDDPGFWQQRQSQQNMMTAAATRMGNGSAATTALHPVGHQRELSAMTFSSMGSSSDGPYPTFAIPNAAKARERDSRMMLEDIPLLGPVDTKLIPQRNPSEDAKRLGLSSRVPPLPGPEGSVVTEKRMQAYHTALADAINKADVAGRFLRAPSVRTEKSLSLYPTDDGEDRSVYSQGADGTASHYSRDENGNVDRKPSNADTVATMDDQYNRSVNYSPPKAGFDFGFDDPQSATTPGYEGNFFSGNTAITDFDDTYNPDEDDDLVAAANAEALALDDGTYGQEFDFYAKARPSSSDAELVNGGFFGNDGDDGLTRNKSIKEPNLTPITERSEFSTRNSFIGGLQFGLPSSGSIAAGGTTSPSLARLPISPLAEHETSLESLRRLRLSAFGGGGGGSSSAGGGSPTTAGGGLMMGGGYFGNFGPAPSGSHGSGPMVYSSSERSSGSFAMNASQQQQQQQSGGGGYDRSSPLRTTFSTNNSHTSGSPAGSGTGQQLQQQFNRPTSTTSSSSSPLKTSIDPDATPRKPPSVRNSGGIVNGFANDGIASNNSSSNIKSNSRGHSRTNSDSVTYVQEADPSGTGQPRWVLERRRTSEQGLEMIVDREILQSGWI